MNRLLNIGIIVTPSIRSIAYLNMFRILGVRPQEAVIIEGDVAPLKELQKENDQYHYSRDFFDIYLNPKTFLDAAEGTTVLQTHCNNLNSQEMHSHLQSLSCEYLIFSGGGILTEETLNLGKKFIHVHPGVIPEYRGSTCFYYSLLKDFSLGATAFFMDKGIDTGNIITIREYRINYDLQPNQSQFIDFILDPFIRALTLKTLLQRYIDNSAILASQQRQDRFQHCFIAHPLLRNLTARKIVSRFQSNSPVGIFEHSPVNQHLK